MNIVEGIILYTVIFLRWIAGPAGEPAPFSTTAELARITLYNIPSLALVWYLLFKAKPPAKWGIRRPGTKDILPGLLTLTGLVLIGFAVTLASRLFNNVTAAPQVSPPENTISWLVLVLSCISTGYLEESFFRFYLLAKRREPGPGPIQAALLSVLAFSICHIYEGPWGFLNAALSGSLLAFAFLRSGSLHGIALAHGLYNILAYVLAAL